MSKFVTAFAGRRDNYQVPLALYEAGRLQRFATTGYATRGLRRMAPPGGRAARALGLRRCPALPDALVDGGPFLELVEQAGRLLKAHPPRYWRYINDRLSERAGRLAEAGGSDLLLYEPYAWPAFRRDYGPRRPVKVLFHFHPHARLESEILDADDRRGVPAGGWVRLDSEMDLDPAAGSARAWTLADRILCASSFTMRSLVRAGAAAEICRVIPYGIDLPHPAPTAPPAPAPRGRFRALFLGSGIQRKGLHHLLSAWKAARLPAGAELTVVCRYIDPAMQRLLAGAPGLRFLPGAGGAELERLFAETSLLAVPSLVEGFGAVFLEAAARGRPVLGTENTCVPDLGPEEDGFFTCRPGDPDDLRKRLEELSQRLPDEAVYGGRAWARARQRPWQRFRRELVLNLP